MEGKYSEPEQDDEPICFQYHSQYGPSNNNKEESNTKRNCSLHSNHTAQKVNKSGK